MHRTFSPALFILPALVLLPFGRGAEYPLAVLALIGAAVTLSGSLSRRSGSVRTLLLLYAAFAVPMVLALPDAVNTERSLLTTLGSLRFIAAALGMQWLLQSAASPGKQRERVLYLVGLVSAVLAAAWCLDGLLQFATGRNVLGYTLAEGYINSVFGDGENLKFGLTLALLLPLALVHALRYWSPPSVIAFVLLTLLLLLLSGKRAAWISGGVELAVLAVYYRARGRLTLPHLAAAAAVCVLAAALAFAQSDWVQRRGLAFLDAVGATDYETLNVATGLRLPIWNAAVAMGSDHWVNGVGPRGFRYAYPQYADAGDRWSQPLATGGARASHAHQLLLEVGCETGAIGLAGLALMVALLLRAWRRADAAARSRALPFAAALSGMLFPLNSHAAWYSSWSGLMLWLFTGLYLYALAPVEASGGDA